MVTGNDGADVIAGGVRPGRILHAAHGIDDELIGRQHQIGGRRRFRPRIGCSDQPRAALLIKINGLGRIEGEQRSPRFG